jgi:hypothetical protein
VAKVDEVVTTREEGRWTGWQSAWQRLDKVATTSKQGGGKSTLKRELERGGSKGQAGGWWHKQVGFVVDSRGSLGWLSF